MIALRSKVICFQYGHEISEYKMSRNVAVLKNVIQETVKEIVEMKRTDDKSERLPKTKTDVKCLQQYPIFPTFSFYPYGFFLIPILLKWTLIYIQCLKALIIH